MQVRFYENPQKTLRVSLDGSDDPLYSGRGADSAFIEIGSEEEDMPFSIPIEYVKTAPLMASKRKEFLEELRRFNPTIFTDAKENHISERGLFSALRKTRKGLEAEINLEGRLEEIEKIRSH